MKKNLCLITLFIFSSFAFISCEKEYSCEGSDTVTEPLQLPVGDSILYYQFTLDNKNYQAIAFQNSFISGTGIRWNTIDHRDSGVVVSGTILPPNTTNFPLAHLPSLLNEG